MAISDLLEKVGTGIEDGVKTAGRVASTVLPALGKGLIDEEAGYAPQIAAERRRADVQTRQHNTALDDEAINQKANNLNQQLEMGRKYGTLTPEQQNQYVDQITQLYSHPRHAPKLMEALRQAIHPNGAVAQPTAPTKPLPNAVPQGGTNAADNEVKIAKEQRKQAEAEAMAEMKAQIAAKYHKPAGKSPQIPGNQLPPDAVGVDGKPLGEEARSAQHSFTEWNGSWWAVAKPKPVFKTVKGHSVLVDAQSGSILRDLGPVGTSKVTTHQTLQPGDDGQMHMVTLTSVSTPGGEKIEVDPQQAEGESGQTETPNPSSQSDKQGNKPGKGVGAVIKSASNPKSQSNGSAKGTVPGFSNLANKKTQTVQDRQVLESSKQIVSAVTDLLPLLEKRKNKGGIFDSASQRIELEKYRHGFAPSDPEMTKIFENSALLSVVGASIWSRIGRSKYTFEVIQQHLPQATDTPELMYDKVKWLRDNVVPAAQEAIKNPQPESIQQGKGKQSKAHSLKTAMSLPFNQGKSEAQVKADLESRGYKVAP